MKGRMYGMGYRGEDEVVWCLDAQTGALKWMTPPLAAANRQVGYPEGSRCTPTFDDGRLYLVGVSGEIACLEAETGKELWRRHLVREFGGQVPHWGYTESPLVDGDRVIVTPGGGRATMVALNKRSGETLWTGVVPQGDPACYSSVIVEEIDGIRQYIQFLAGGIVSVAANDGRFLWRTNRPANGIVISTPVYHDHHVFASTAYNRGGGLYQLATENGVVTPTEVYFSQEMQNHHGGIILLGDHIYYAEGHGRGVLVCREFKTGKLVWQERNPHKGSLVLADGHFYYRSERGTMLLIEASPRACVVKGEFEQPDRSGKYAWAHPVVVNGRLYLRDQDLMLCYALKDDVA
jgi:outer membrane protein assembly factor BamB